MFSQIISSSASTPSWINIFALELFLTARLNLDAEPSFALSDPSLMFFAHHWFSSVNVNSNSAPYPDISESFTVFALENETSFVFIRLGKSLPLSFGVKFFDKS